MRLTRFTDYSLRVLIYLGQNTHNRVTIHQISESYDISKNHLMKVVCNLTRHELVTAQRGPGGGIRLNQSPEKIRLSEVICNTEKHIELLDDGVELDLTEQTPTDRLGTYLDFALKSYLQALGQFTLADVLSAEPIAMQMMSPGKISI
jgi:Rrf2 family nitric oxide-sensitive transcriptional repressor